MQMVHAVALTLQEDTEVALREGSSTGFSQIFPATILGPVGASITRHGKQHRHIQVNVKSVGIAAWHRKALCRNTNSDIKISADELAMLIDIDSASVRPLYCFWYWCFYLCQAFVITCAMWYPEHRVFVQMELLLNLKECQVFSYLSSTLNLHLWRQRILEIPNQNCYQGIYD